MTAAPMTNVNPDTIALASASRPSLAVYDGQVQCGTLVRRGTAFEAFDVDGQSYGVFADMKTAAFALPTRSAP